MSLSSINSIDFEKYRKEYESDEHWKLRKAFLRTHCESFDEDTIQCLAQLFINIELLGCKYSAETMSKVAALANQVEEIRIYRESRKVHLKRTFVGAQDAIQAKILKTDAPKRFGIQETSSTSTSFVKFNEAQIASNLQNLLRNVIYFEFPGTDECDEVQRSLNKTITFMSKQGKLEQTYDIEDKKYLYIFDGRIVGEGEGTTKKIAKKIADENLIETLKSNCYTIRHKLAFFSPEDVIRKGENSTPQNLIDRNKIQESNLGFKMLKMLGWDGGSLGTKGDGIIDPVNCEIKIGRSGLGSNGDEFDAKHIRNLLRNFKNNQVEYDLVFSSEFTKEERAQIHQIANQLDLRAKSFGKEGNRQIVISTKMSPQMLKERLLQGDDKYLLEKYEIISPQLNKKV